MGVWGVGISSNDTYADVYSEFFDLYNEGKDVIETTEKIIANNTEILQTPEECNDLWFALAKAQWECKELQPDVFEKVRSIIDSSADIQNWRDLGASPKEIEKRRKSLVAFIQLLEYERPRAKKRKKKVIRQPIFATGDCLSFRLASGNFGGAVILASEFDTELGQNLVAVTRIDKTERPTISDFERAEILIRNWANWDDREAICWISKYRISEVVDLFDVECSMKIVGDFLSKEAKYKYSFTSGWKSAVIDCANSQFESEKTKPRPKEKLFVAKFIGSSTRKFW